MEETPYRADRQRIADALRSVESPLEDTSFPTKTSSIPRPKSDVYDFLERLDRAQDFTRGIDSEPFY